MKHFLLFFVLSAFLMTMCKTEISVDNTDLIGKWNVVTGERNGQNAPYFSGFFIEFKDGNVIMTNINESSENEPGEYQLDKHIITQKTGSGELVYSIEVFDESSMTVLTKMSGNDLKFVLKKSN